MEIDYIRVTIFLAFFCLSLSENQLSCINGGILIMVRTKYQPYSIQYQCLCPFIYYGETCGFFRDIYCFYSNQQIIKYDPNLNNVAKLQFQMECFLKKLNNQSSILRPKTKQTNNFLQLPLTASQVELQQKSTNYYINEDYQIIWANTTSIFNSKGQIIRNGSDSRTDEQILDSYPHYDFNYTDNFYGVPLSDVKIQHSLNSVRFIDKDISINQNLEVSFEQSRASELIQNRTKIIGRIQTNINENWGQFGVVRLQLTSNMKYGNNYDLFHRLSMNSGRWRLFNPNLSHGQVIDVNNSRIPGSFWVLFVFIMLFGLITLSRVAIKQYKKWRNKKISNQLQEQSVTQNQRQ